MPAPVSPFFLFPVFVSCARIKTSPARYAQRYDSRETSPSTCLTCSPAPQQPAYATWGHRNPLPHHRDSPHIQRERKTGVFKKSFHPHRRRPQQKVSFSTERNIIVVQHICRNVTLTTSRSTSTDVYTIMLRVAHLYAQLYPLDETYFAAAGKDSPPPTRTTTFEVHA